MADISIRPVDTVSTTPMPAITPQTRATGAAAAQGTEAAQGADSGQSAREAQEARQDRIREQLENVISVSRDGDTVQATEESRERLEEDAFGHVEVRQEQGNQAGVNGAANQETTGEVTELAIEERTRTAIEGSESQQAIAESVQDRLVGGTRSDEAIAEAVERQVTGTSRTEEAIELGNERAEREEAEEEYIEKLTSYQGISDMKLEQMYLQGEISKIDYDQEMESREQEREAENDNANQFSTQMTGLNGLENGVRLDQQQIEDVFSTEANDNISATDRMEILQTLNNETAQASQAALDISGVSDANTSGEEAVRRVVFS